MVASKETVNWHENPFQFKLSCEYTRGSIRVERIAIPCSECGSVKILGRAQQRRYLKTKMVFCDQDCTNLWRSRFYASPKYQWNKFKKDSAKARRNRRNVIKNSVLYVKTLEQIKECPYCLRMFSSASRYCSSKCKSEFYRIEQKKKGIEARFVNSGKCVECNNQIEPRKWCRRSKYCSVVCAARAQRRNRKHLRRAIIKRGDTISIVALANRYDWLCCYCKTKCLRPTGVHSDRQASIDHIIPLSKGGLHTWSNVQLLCMRCNSEKSAMTMEEFVVFKEISTCGEQENPRCQNSGLPLWHDRSQSPSLASTELEFLHED